MGKSEITAAAMAVTCVFLGMSAFMLRDYVKGSHEEQMARIEIVRINEATRLQMEEMRKATTYETRKATQRALKKAPATDN